LGIDVAAVLTSAGCSESRNGRRKTTGDDHEIEKVPTVGAEALETKTVEADQQIESVKDRKEEEDPV